MESLVFRHFENTVLPSQYLKVLIVETRSHFKRVRVVGAMSNKKRENNCFIVQPF